MANRSEESVELFQTLVDRGYSPQFCNMIADQLNTTWTANRMLGYLRYLPVLREEDIVDEMIEILCSREQIRQKKEMEHAQSIINEIYANGIDGVRPH